MAEDKKALLTLYEDLHTEIAEVRKESLKPEVVAALMQGAVAALHAQMQAQNESLRKGHDELRQDRAQTTQEIQQLVASNAKLCAALMELVTLMKAPIKVVRDATGKISEFN